jgi:hypothetical protein
MSDAALLWFILVVFGGCLLLLVGYVIYCETR